MLQEIVKQLRPKNQILTTRAKKKKKEKKKNLNTKGRTAPLRRQTCFWCLGFRTFHHKLHKSLGIFETMDMCACSLTNEHPGTRRCTIHQCTVTTTLTQKHNTSRQFRTHPDQSRSCLSPLLRVCGRAPLNHCWSIREPDVSIRPHLLLLTSDVATKRHP